MYHTEMINVWDQNDFIRNNIQWILNSVDLEDVNVQSNEMIWNATNRSKSFRIQIDVFILPVWCNCAI